MDVREDERLRVAIHRDKVGLKNGFVGFGEVGLGVPGARGSGRSNGRSNAFIFRRVDTAAVADDATARAMDVGVDAFVFLKEFAGKGARGERGPATAGFAGELGAEGIRGGH